MEEGWGTDEELVGRYKGEPEPHEREALLNELFRRYYARVRDWCSRLTGDPESARDIAQDVFMKAFRHLGSYQGGSKFSTWLYSIARNHCVSVMRARNLRPELDGQELLPGIPDGQPGPERLMERAESSRLLRVLIETSLDDRERQVMALHYAEELPLEVITQRMGLGNASGAKAYMVSARRKLELAFRRLCDGRTAAREKI